MKLLETKEIIENGTTYIVETYDNGTINKYIKSELSIEPPAKQPTNGVQRGHTELNGVNVVIPLELIDVSKATAAINVQGCDTPYTYTLAEDALTVAFAEPVQAWINWEVQG